MTARPEVNPQLVPSAPEVTARPEVNPQLLPSPPEVTPQTPEVTAQPEVTARPEVKKWYPSTALLHNEITGLYICVGCCRLTLVVLFWGDFQQRMRMRYHRLGALSYNLGGMT